MHIHTHTRINIHAAAGNNHLLIRLAWNRAAGEKYMPRGDLYTRLLLALFLCVLDFNWVDVFIYQRRSGIRSKVAFMCLMLKVLNLWEKIWAALDFMDVSLFPNF